MKRLDERAANLSELGREAVAYLRRGLAIIPLDARKKAPATEHGLKDATTLEGLDNIVDWYESYPNDNVAIVTGKISGNLGVIDIDLDDDSGKDGYEFLRRWEHEHGELPETWTVETARGGMHMYYRFDGGVPRNSSNEELAIDFRGEGGYVMAPPSIHPNGNVVCWDNHPDDYDLAWADDNVLAFLDAIRPAPMVNAVTQRFELPEVVTKGGRDDTMFRYAASLQSKGMADAEIMILCKAMNRERFTPPMEDWQVEQKVRSALRYDKGKRGKTAKPMEPYCSINLAVNGRGAPLQTTENHIRVLVGDELLAGHFRYNEITYTRDIVLPVPWERGEGTRAIKDTDYINFSAYCEKYYGLMSKNKATDAILSVAEDNHYNPLREWLDGLRWDGIPRADTLFSMFLGAEPSDYNMAVSRLFLRGAVRRAYEPGAKFDYMPILVGRQGLGKSYFLRMLCGNSAYYCDNLNTIEGDAAIEKLRGMWIVELAELLATKRQKDVESLKAFTTSTVDTIRPKYARETEQRPRVCVFAGTTNSVHFLTDRTGNRRQLPVECGVHEPLMSLFEDGTAEHFEQAWAEVVAEYKTDRPALLLPASVADFAEEVKEGHMEDDPRVGLIQAYLDQVCDDASRTDKRVCIAEILENALNVQKEIYIGKMQLSREVGEILRHQTSGWVRMPKKQRLRDWGSQWAYCPDCLLDVNGRLWLKPKEDGE